MKLFICRLHFPVVSETPFGEASSPWAPQPVSVRSPGTPSWGNLPCAPSPCLGLLIALGTSSPSPGSLLPFWPRQFHVLRQLRAVLCPSSIGTPPPTQSLVLLSSPLFSNRVFIFLGKSLWIPNIVYGQMTPKFTSLVAWASSLNSRFVSPTSSLCAHLNIDT